MKINFNRDNITKGIIIGCIGILTTMTGYKLVTDSKKNAKLVNTKNNKQYEEENDQATSSNTTDDYQYKDSLLVIPGYHLDGNRYISNIIILKAEDGVNNKIPDNYHLEILNDKPYAVYNGYHAEIQGIKIISVKDEIDKEKKDEKNTLTVDGITYIAPVGYTLENRNGSIVAVRQTKEYKMPSYVLTKDGQCVVAPLGYTLEQQEDGTYVATKTFEEIIEPTKEKQKTLTK